MLGPSSNIMKINGKVKNDNWGGENYIADLLSIDNKSKLYSEYWLGVHPLHPATIADKYNTKLINYLNLKLHNSLKIGETSFPFLLKVLDVDKMLSIQLHPNAINAKKGFEKEQLQDFCINAQDRIYKDPNSKYEALFALTDFYLLQGFLEREKLIFNIEKYFSVAIRDRFVEGGYLSLCKYILSLNNNETLKTLNLLFAKIKNAENRYCPNAIEYWLLKCLSENPDYILKADKGFIFMCLLNLIKLKQGEVIYTKPGVLHSYLHGKCLEVMSNSDNVIRLGLTRKSIGHDEILRNLTLVETIPTRIDPYKKENILSKYIFKEPNFTFTIVDTKALGIVEFESDQIQIIFTAKGLVNIRYDDNKINIKKGEAAIIMPNTKYKLEANAQTLAIVVSSITPFIET